MTTVMPHVERFATRHHHPATTVGLVVAFWIMAAALVAAVHVGIEPRSVRAASVATIAALLAAAWAYSRFVAREAGISHALGVGTTWLMLSITVEVAVTMRAGHAWFTLLGSPDRPLLRNVLLFVWVFAPVVFARREPTE
jgi:hypothetical protein